MNERIFANMTLSEKLTAADIFSVIRKFGVEIASFYKENSLISAEMFDALAELAEKTTLIAEIEALIEKHRTGNKSQKEEALWSLEQLASVNGETVNIIANLLRA